MSCLKFSFEGCYYVDPKRKRPGCFGVSTRLCDGTLESYPVMLTLSV